MTRRICSALMIFALLGQAAAQETPDTTDPQQTTPALPTPEDQNSPPADAAPADTAAPANTAAPTDSAIPTTPAAPPTPPAAPLTSRLYAGANVTFGSSTSYGIAVGSTQVFGAFGAQLDVDYVTVSGALSVDALLLYRPQLKGKFLPYAGVGLGLTSSPDANPVTDSNGNLTPNQTATDYAGQVVAGADYLLTESIALGAEVGYRSAFSSKGTDNGTGARARLGLKFFF